MSSSFNQQFDHLKIPLKDIQTATSNFANKNIVGRDGFGNEYKGQLLLSSGNLIDIVARRLDTTISGHGPEEFQTEIKMLHSLKHQNLVSIVGFCDENGEKIIVNKFEARLSLARYLSDPVTLTWTQRLQICLGIARALSYIHYDEGRDFSVIHRDVKSSKILLSDKWEAKLSGFELSTIQPTARRDDLLSDLPCGSIGYVDPTYVKSESVTHKSDVYSFGVVLFEVLSGRKAYIPDNNGVFLVKLARSHYENGTLSDIIDSGLQNQMDSQALKVFSETAYSCLKEQHSQRPNIDQVIFALEQALNLQLAYNIPARNLENLKIGFDAIQLATQNFSRKYYIGSDGYCNVYKAELEHFDSFAMKGNQTSELPRRRSTVAIKHILSREDTQGQQSFLSEIEALTSCIHPNIVSLLGFCDELDHLIIVYEYVSNGSIGDYLRRKEKMANLTWVQRIKLCIDIARGLDYLHSTTDYKQKLIHRDIKSDNILLDLNFKAKISNFGLSKFHPRGDKGSTTYETVIAGSEMYIDPEYMRTGKLKAETDLYSFGVVLFEILTGRLACDSVYMEENGDGLAPIVRQHFKRGTLKELLDPVLKKERDEKNFTQTEGLNEDSLHTFYEIGHRCLAEQQAQRPSIKDVIHELYRALYFQEFPDNLHIPFEDIRRATGDFSLTNLIGNGGFGRAYRGEMSLKDEPSHIVAKRNDTGLGQGEEEFLTEIEILFQCKHENIISLVGYCKKVNERILVYEYASNGSLNRYVKHASLTWTKRLQICIDVAMGLDFLHRGTSTQAVVIHRDIKSTNILLNGDWKAKIGDFGLSRISPGNNGFDVMIDTACGTYGYIDPLYLKGGLLSRESDIYSLGVVLLEMMCGRIQDPHKNLVDMVKQYHKEGKVDDLVFEGIKNQIVPKSLIAFVNMACECLHDEREKRPTASKVVLQLKEALKFQLDG
ncbi:putative protein kinase RLK-Pelle-LRR-I-1 family [Helianthus debilis subsp. tardiflorus]